MKMKQSNAVRILLEFLDCKLWKMSICWFFVEVKIENVKFLSFQQDLDQKILPIILFKNFCFSKSEFDLCSLEASLSA